MKVQVTHSQSQMLDCLAHSQEVELILQMPNPAKPNTNANERNKLTGLSLCLEYPYTARHRRRRISESPMYVQKLREKYVIV